MTDAPPRPGPDWLKIIGEAGLIVGLSGAWLYLAGWRYAEQYFAAFGIGISTIELKREYLITYGFWTARHYALPLLALGGILCGAVWMLRRSPRPIAPSVIIGLTGLLTIFLFVLAHSLGGALAQQRYEDLRENGYPGHRNLRIAMGPDWSQDDPELLRLAEALNSPEACYRLIFADAESVFVFRPVASQPEFPVEILHLDRKSIRAMRIRETERSCSL